MHIYLYLGWGRGIVNDIVMGLCKKERVSFAGLVWGRERWREGEREEDCLVMIMGMEESSVTIKVFADASFRNVVMGPTCQTILSPPTLTWGYPNAWLMP